MNFKTQSAGNIQNTIVETPETIRTVINSISFGQWLAGLIDGDGCLLVSKHGYTSLEITIGLEDLSVLLYIQSVLGGTVKKRNGINAYRYRLHNITGILALINFINGHIRHSGRLVQLQRVCIQLNINILKPVTLNYTSSWFGGFFDADGTLGFYMKNGTPQLAISVTNKYKQDINYFVDVFGGYIYEDTSQFGCFKWIVQSRSDVLKIRDYFVSGHCRSHKSFRFTLINEYYRLRDMKAYNPDSEYYTIWVAFVKKWNKLKI